MSSFFQKIVKLFSYDIGIDLGTANTLVNVKDQGIVLREPSVVAVKGDKVLAVGDEAKRMLGRTPGSVTAIRPLKDGVIADFYITEEMLRYFIKKATARYYLIKPRVLIAIPSGITEVERRALADAARGAGARDVLMLDEPLAAAVGADLPVFEPIGSMVVDIGGGTTDVAVLALGGIAASASVRTGGTHLDAAIREHVQKAHGVMVGERTAEEIKIALGNALPGGTERMQVRGRKLDTGLPTSLTLCSMSSSSRSDTLREMASGSRDSFSVAVNWRSMFSMASMRVMS